MNRPESEMENNAMIRIEPKLHDLGEASSSDACCRHNPRAQRERRAHRVVRRRCARWRTLCLVELLAASRDRNERAKREWTQGSFAAVPGETEFIALPERCGVEAFARWPGAQYAA